MKKLLLSILHYILLPFIAIGFIFNVMSIKRKAKKYAKNPKDLFVTDRQHILYKAIKKSLFIKNVKIISDGFDSLPKKPILFIANHKSAMDPMVLYKCIHETEGTMPISFVAKEELNSSSIVSAAMKLMDCVTVQRDNLRSVYESFLKQDELVKLNYSICIFPEGTRHFGHEFGEFLPASLKVGYQNFLTIVPIAIYGTSGMLDGKVKSFNNKKRVIYIKALKPVQPTNYINIKQDNLMHTLKNNLFHEYEVLKRMYDKDQKFIKEEK